MHIPAQIIYNKKYNTPNNHQIPYVTCPKQMETRYQTSVNASLF